MSQQLTWATLPTLLRFAVEDSLALSWSALNSLGRNRVLATSYFWFAFVPIAARVFDQLDSLLTFKLFGAQISMNTHLPFSWEMFFYAAVAFSVGGLIYNLRCPSIISKYDSLGDFRDEGKQARMLPAEFVKNASSADGALCYEFLRRFTSRQLPPVSLSDDGDDYWNAMSEALIGSSTKKGRVPHSYFARQACLNAISEVEVRSEQEGEIFFFIRDHCDRLRLPSRILCTVSYTVGLILVGTVALQQFIFVLNYSLKGVS